MLRSFLARIQSLGTHRPRHWQELRVPTQTARPDRVLDAGCGEGEMRRLFERFGQSIEYIGIDLGVGDQASFRVTAVADLHRLPFADRSFDKIVSNEVLEHVDHPDVVFGELARVLRPGGRFHFSVPLVWHLHQEPYDRFRYTAHAIEFLARRHGFAVRKIQPAGGYFTVLRYLASNYSFLAHDPSPVVRAFGRPLQPVLKVLDRVFFAPLAWILDHLDRSKKLTIGYFVSLEREGAATIDIATDPYVCPDCRGSLERGSVAWNCKKCGKAFRTQSGVPILVASPALPKAFKIASS